ncbi:CC_3452 family protein [Pseudoblastomonas halimionae]|uniref:Uncharacterized protein n=1 Tax=Alteriqipengyuania halimionae TaxID=1926630 RepID=A0A6I4U726_9SPHN|nr:hypothetical protein [Alteriqipengyuania halimionae]MXP10252.1 hypothetical protein [Alteriqipengyuania halimionae]
MTLPRSLSLAAIAMVGAVSTFAATAPAQAVFAPYYAAELATPVEKPTTDIQKGLLWDCEGNSCVAAKKNRSRDMIVCQRLAGKFGDVTAFRAANKVFDEADLAKCNG